jgi:Ni2+-binding GTPase involved in maturation of urease and hydrogenase
LVGRDHRRGGAALEIRCTAPLHLARHLLPIESGGDNLAAAFSPELADLTIP